MRHAQLISTGLLAAAAFGLTGCGESAPTESRLPPAPAVREISDARSEPAPDAAVHLPDGSLPGPAMDPQLRRAVWVEGRLVLPPGTPPDERVEVYAVGDRFRLHARYVALADADGRFRVAFDPMTRLGELQLGAQHLYLARERILELWDPLGDVPRPHPGEVVLAPLLGGRVTGRLRLPGGWEGAAPEAEVVLHGAGLRRTAPALHAGAFAFDAVPAGLYRLEVVCPDFATVRRGGLLVRAGETLALELDLEREVLVEGQVLDARGEPVDGARVFAERVSLARPEVLGSTWAGPRGEFLLRGLPPGRLRLSAARAGHRSATLELGTLGPGDVRADLDLTLRDLARLSGRVLWPDGRAARGVTVEVVTGSLTLAGAVATLASGAQRVRSGSDGRFEFRIASEVPVSLRASIRLGDDGRASADGAPFSAMLHDLEPGATDLELRLSPDDG